MRVACNWLLKFRGDCAVNVRKETPFARKNTELWCKNV